MALNRSKTISLTLPEMLLARIDKLAKRDYATRSDIIRQAALQYVRESGVDESNDEPNIGETEVKNASETEMPSKKLKPQRDYEELARKYPQANPDDRQLLEFLDDYTNNRL